MTQLDRFVAFCTEKFERWLQHVQANHDAQVPKNVQAQAVVQLYRFARVHLQGELEKEERRFFEEGMRRFCGFCQQCNARVDNERCFPPLCEHCDAREAAEVERINKMMEEQ